jgi:hypothetical protein
MTTPPLLWKDIYKNYQTTTYELLDDKNLIVVYEKENVKDKDSLNIIPPKPQPP